MEENHGKVIVAGALIEKENKYLFIKESKGPAKGKWNIPAGKWCWGESISQCVEREVKEESGYDFEATNVLGILTTQKQEKDLAVIIVVFSGILGKAGEAVDSEELRWFTKEEVLALDSSELRMALIRKVIVDYEKGIKYPLDIIKEDI